MEPQRVQLGRRGPQLTFTWHQGRACVVDHGRGRSVTNAAEDVCRFLAEQLPDMPADHDIVYLATDGAWCVLALRGGQFAGAEAGYRPATGLEAGIAVEALDAVLGAKGAA